MQLAGVGIQQVYSLNSAEYHIDLEYFESKEITPATSSKFINPRTNLNEGHYFNSRSLVTITDPKLVVDSSTGIVFLDNKILVESSAWPGLWLILNSIPFPIWPRKFPSGHHANYVLIPSNGFYHSLIEDIPIFLTQLSLISRPVILLPKSANSWIKELVDSLPYPVIPISRFYKPLRHQFISRSGDTGWPHPADIETLRKSLLPKSQPEPSLRIYISRLESSRSPIFESDLCLHLENLGWRICYLERLSLNDQITLLNSAKIVAGVHGAGLAGMVWMQKGAKVIELGPKRFVPCYARLADMVELRYKRIQFDDDVVALKNLTDEIIHFSELA